MKNTRSDDKGRYGEYGGCYIPEILVTPIAAVQQAFSELRDDQEFLAEFNAMLIDYAGRPTALTEVKNFAKAINGPRIFLKREDLLHTGAHKINNALGQCLLAKRLGKTRIIAETGAGQHGVATATACARLGLQCCVYMGAVDMQRQMPNVLRMRLLGAEVIAVESGSQTLKDAVNEALRDWSASFQDTHYCIGSVVGPSPFPEMVAFFHQVIGEETQQQCQKIIGADPDYIVACVGGGSNAIGIFSAFLDQAAVKLIGVEAGGRGPRLGEHAARFTHLAKGVLQGYYTYLLQDDHGQIAQTHSISAGLDYPAVGPQHAALFDAKRVEYVSAQDDEVLEAFKLLSKTEGIIPAFESAHALAYVMNHAERFAKEDVVVINLSGRGDKDLPEFFEKYEAER